MDEKKFGGCIKNFSKNLRYEKNNRLEIEGKNRKKSIFCKFFITNYIFLSQILIWNDFSFHLIYILPIKVKNDEISKIVVPKASGQTRLLRRSLTTKLFNIEK